MKPNLNAPTLAFQNLNQFYQKCSQENLQMGDVDQSIDQFLRMKGIEPNEQGTGRISFKDVKKIECLFIKEKRRGNTQKQYRSYFAKITDLLQAYLNIPATFIDNQLEIEKSSIEDPHRRLLYTLKRNKSRFDALQILDLLTEYKNEHNLLIAWKAEKCKS